MWRRINPRYDALCFDWKGNFDFCELLNFDEAQVAHYILRKQFFGFSSIDDYFSRLYEAGMAYDFFNRLESFDIEKWWTLRKDGATREVAIYSSPITRGAANTPARPARMSLSYFIR